MKIISVIITCSDDIVVDAGGDVVDELRGGDGGRVDGHQVRQAQRTPFLVAQVYYHQFLFC